MNKHLLETILYSDDIVSAFNDNIDILFDIVPELECMVGFDQKHPHHHLDLWNHTLEALRNSKKDIDIRLSLLLHDIGKPLIYTETEGVRHYKNHPYISAVIANSILKRLGYDSDYIEKICYLIRNHDAKICSEDVIKDYELELKRLEIQRCDALAHNPTKQEKRLKYIENTKKLFN